MARIGINYFIMDILVLLTLVSFIFVISDFSKLYLIIHLGFLLLYLVLFFAGLHLVYKGNRFGWTLMGINCIIIIGNILVVFLLAKSLNMQELAVIIFAVLGLFISLMGLVMSSKSSSASSAGSSKPYYPFMEKVEPKQEEPLPEIKKDFSPGKYVASRKASTFHAPKCDWALKIRKENQVWFDSAEEAKSKGYKADSCV